MKIVWTLLCFLAISLFISVVPVEANPNEGITAITIPSADVTLSFIQPGNIAKVLIKDGEAVKTGQLLIQLDNAAEQAQLLRVKAESEDRTQIEAAEASLAQKKVDLERLEWAGERGSATDLEVEHARLDLKIAELSLKVAQFEHKQNELKYKEAQIRVDNMSLKSPITGTIDKIDVEVGEAVRGLAGVVRVVKTDPLWIDVFVPLAKGRTLKLGEIVKVKFPGPEEKVSEGIIIYISTVADAASSTLRVRIEVPNELHRPAGEHVHVTFSIPEKQPDSNDISQKEKE